MNLRSFLAGLVFLVLGSPSLVPAQNTYNWTHNDNNNWDHAGNWSGASGYPNAATDSINFDSSHYNASQAEVDTEGQTFDVDNIIMTNADDVFTFRSSVASPGLIRLHGDFLFNNDNANEVAPHEFEVNLEVVNASTWTSGGDQYLEFRGVLSGNGTITAHGNALGAGYVQSRWFNANTFNGTLILDNVGVDLRDPNAFQFADVVIHANNAFMVDHLFNKTINIGSLSGTGFLDFQTNDFVTTSNANTTFSGTLKSTGTNSAIRNFTKAGGGTLTLAGNITNFGTLFNTGAGTTEITSGGDWRKIQVGGGLLDIRNGAHVELKSTDPSVFIVNNGGNAFIREGADVELTGVNIMQPPRVIQFGSSLIGVHGAGSTLSALRISIGSSGGGGSLFVVESDGAVDTPEIEIGDAGPVDGTTGALSVSSGGRVGATRIDLFRRGSIHVNGGQVTTNVLASNNSTEDLTISDGPPGSALILGANNGSSTLGNVIKNNIGGAGSIRKEGNGMLTLGGANTFSGGVTINGGTLFLENTSGSAAGSGDVNVNSGATLAGNGSAVGMVLVNDGGAVSPGASAGVLSLNSVTFAAGSTLEIQLGGLSPVSQHDLLVANNAITLGGTLDLSYISPYTAAPGDEFHVIHTNAGALNGTFDSVIYPDGQTWFIQYDLEDGEVIVGLCVDGDGDGVCDAGDICPGFDDHIDSDSDGVPDGCDVCPGFNDNADADSDGIPDGCDVCPGFNDSVDADGDGIPDGCDACPNRRTGDVSGDGMISIDDVPLFAAVLLNPDAAAPDEFCAADINEDGAVNGLDAQGMVDLLLSP